MILFFKLEPDDWNSEMIVQEFFSRFRKKLETPFNLLNFPFSKKLLYENEHKFFYAFLLDIAWLKFYWIGFMGLVTCFILGLSPGWFIMPGLMSLMFVFWSPWLYLWLFRKGLRKAGFKGKVKRLSSEAFCLEVLMWDK